MELCTLVSLALILGRLGVVGFSSFFVLGFDVVALLSNRNTTSYLTRVHPRAMQKLYVQCHYLSDVQA